MKLWTCLLLGFALGSVALAEELDLASKMINKKTNGTWYVQPDKPKAQHIKANVLGDYAFRIRATKGAHPWDVQANSPVEGAINQGDVIMLVYYARAEEAAEGGSSITVSVQMNSSPWTAALQSTAKLSGDWQKFCAARVASIALPEKKGNINIALATDKQIIDLGPVFVFNLGKDFNAENLKSECGD